MRKAIYAKPLEITNIMFFLPFSKGYCSDGITGNGKTQHSRAQSNSHLKGAGLFMH
jgi:hypothetical protein